MSTWKLMCVSASVASTKSNLQMWDTTWDSMGPGNGGPPGGGGPGNTLGYLPDPVCRLRLGGDAIGTSTMILTDTLTPKWNESITPMSPMLTAALLMSQSTPWAISVDDDDGRDGTEPICRVTPQLSASDFVSTDVTFTNVQSCTTLSLHLACNP